MRAEAPCTGRRPGGDSCPRWSIVTVTHDSASSLRDYAARSTVTDDVEWIVVDNASTDDSVALATGMGAHVIEMAANGGFAAGCNHGLAHARGRYVAFVNPDVQFDTHAWGPLAAVIEEREHALVAPQLEYPDGRPQPNGRGRPTLAAKVMHRLAPSRAHGRYALLAADDQVLEATWLMGAFVAGRREWLLRLGGWDERYFLYYEDSDLGLHNIAAGGTNLVVGSVRAVHGWQRATTRVAWAPWRAELASAARFYTRHPELLFPARRRRAEGLAA